MLYIAITIVLGFAVDCQNKNVPWPSKQSQEDLKEGDSYNSKTKENSQYMHSFESEL